MGPGAGTLHPLPEVPNNDVVPASSFLLNVHCLPCSDGHLGAPERCTCVYSLACCVTSLGPLGSFELNLHQKGRKN